MAIQFFTDRIKVGDFTLFEGNGGLQFDGVARAENFKGKGFQGDSRGYTAGNGPGASTPSNTIQKYPFSSTSNSTDVGDLAVAMTLKLGSPSSSTHGYICGGRNTDIPTPYPANSQNTIQKFPFSVDTNGSDIGDLLFGSYGGNNRGSSSSEKGYASGGVYYLNTINSFPFATDTNATDVGDAAYVAMYAFGNSSLTHGYISGGGSSPSVRSRNDINKFPFATNTNATDIADLNMGTEGGSSQDSFTHGYLVGINPPIDTNRIQKFSFASNANGTEVGNLTAASNSSAAGSSSREHGYVAGGSNSTTTIQRFTFASDLNSTNVGTLFEGSSTSRDGCQV